MNRTDIALLALIAAQPRSGYDIRQAVVEQLSHFWNESPGNIYPRLRRLHEQGLLRRRTERTAGRPDRHVYSITAAGRQSLMRWFEAGIHPDPPRNELLLKLFFGRLAPRDVLAAQVTAYREMRAGSLEQYRAIRRMLDADAAGHPDLAWWRMTLRAGEVAAQAAVKWADETLTMLHDMEA